MAPRRRDSVDRAIKSEQDSRSLRLKAGGQSGGDTTPFQLTIEAAVGIEAGSGNALVPGMQTVEAASMLRLSYMEMVIEMDMAAIRTLALGGSVPGLTYTTSATMWKIRGVAEVTGGGLDYLKLADDQSVQLPVGLVGTPDDGVTMNTSPVSGRLERNNSGYGTSGTSYFVVFYFMASLEDYPTLTDLTDLDIERVYFQGEVLHND